MTCVAALGDECAFWMSDESANPDVEILNAVRPALATTQGPLIAISSPYARRGALWDTYKKHFGPEGDPSILVAQGATRDFNPDSSGLTLRASSLAKRSRLVSLSVLASGLPNARTVMCVSSIPLVEALMRSRWQSLTSKARRRSSI